MSRIIEKINARRQKRQTQQQQQEQRQEQIDDEKNHHPLPPRWYYSFEFFPPKTEAGLDNLLTRIDRMTSRLDPLYIDVTWGAGGSTSARTLAVASHAQRFCGVDVLMHLTTTGMTRPMIERALEQAKACGIRNILALRGDPPRGKRSWQQNDVSGGYCDRAIDLVRLIRELHGDYFGIAVAGHPERHPSSVSWDDELQHLKSKMESGADFIVTQFFYDVGKFLEYVKRCRDYGITCPIIPGIMPIQSFSAFTKMTKYCGVDVPATVIGRLEAVKDDDEAVKEIGCDIAADMCRQILCSPDHDIDGVHFYTLNLERSVTSILSILGAIDVIKPGSTHSFEAGGSSNDAKPTTTQAMGTKTTSVGSMEEVIRANTERPFPWKPSALAQRSKEEVRPINWANRPKSYVMRTEDWDEFPNGRWGDSTSPAFGELSDLSHFYSFSLGSDEDRRAMLGNSPKTHQDVHEVFALYIEGTIPHIPWCDTPLQPESFALQPQLAKLNRAGFLTINSQPSVNGIPSSDKIFGWGGPGGYIYQKAYCECFCSPKNLDLLVSMVKRNPQMNLYAVSFMGQETNVGLELGGVTALTWGVFPNREILQPTIFDPNAYLVWAEEAFMIWTSMWLNLYDFGTESRELLEDIRDTYYLVAIIDNDFVSASMEGSNLLESIMAVSNTDDQN